MRDLSRVHHCVFFVSSVLLVSGCHITDPLKDAGLGMSAGMDMMQLDASMRDLGGKDLGPDTDFAKPDPVPDQGMDQGADLDMAAPCTSNPVFREGTGTSSDPFVVCNAEQFLAMRSMSGSVYELAADIDLGEVDWQPIDVFTGQLDGKGFSVRRLTVMGESSFGGFCNVLTGRLRDVRFEDLKVFGSGENVGGVVYLSQGAMVENVHVQGLVEGESYVGAFASRVSRGSTSSSLYSDVTIEANVTVTGEGVDVGAQASAAKGQAGLFAGAASDVTLLNVHTRGVINADAMPFGGVNLGGVVGKLSSATLGQSSADVIMNASHSSRVGGLVGEATDVIMTHGWSTGSLETLGQTGGVVGVSKGENMIEYMWSIMLMEVDDGLAQGMVGEVEVGSSVTGQECFYNSELVEQDTLMFSTGYSKDEMRSADNYVMWPSPPWIISDGEFPALPGQP